MQKQYITRSCQLCQADFPSQSRSKGEFCSRRCLMRSTFSERFWSHVDQTDDCWLWTGSHDPLGYGKFSVDGRVIGTHRISYAIANGPIPDGMFVCHHCDNPPCVRPEHLFLGSDGDNSRDMVAKRRHWSHVKPEAASRGEMRPDAKLTEALVQEIRQRHANGEPLGSLSAAYGVSKSTIHLAARRRRWSHVT